MVDLQAALQKDGSASAIIQEGERGYLEEIVDDELPGDQQIAPDGIMQPTPASVFQIHKSDCRKNKKDRQDQEDMCGRAFAIILSMVNEDVIRKIRHIRDDKDYRNKDKAEYVIANHIPAKPASQTSRTRSLSLSWMDPNFYLPAEMGISLGGS